MKKTNHFVSPETPQHQPVPIDEDHASLEDQPDTDDIVGESQYGIQPEMGAEDERDVKTKSRTTLGRHVTSEHGLKVAARRHSHITKDKREGEKVFKRGAKR